MLTPGAYLTTLRLLLAVGASAVAACLIGVATPPPAFDALSGDVAVRAGALYALTLLAFAALPRMRRDDLAGAVAALVCVAEAFHAVILHRVAPLPLVVDIAGVCAAWAPAAVEQYRRLAREARYVAFRDIALRDRRTRTLGERVSPAAQAGVSAIASH